MVLKICSRKNGRPNEQLTGNKCVRASQPTTELKKIQKRRSRVTIYIKIKRRQNLNGVF